MTTTSKSGQKVTAVLWTVQVLLATVFLFAGGMKLVLPVEALTAQTPLPGALLRFIGTVEVLGALGLMLPGLVRIRTELTPLAAGGLVIIMSGAVGFTLAGHDAPLAWIPGVIGLLAAAVAYGRSRLVPLRTRRSTVGTFSTAPSAPRHVQHLQHQA